MAKKSGRETNVRDVTGVPGSAGGSPKAGVVKRVHQGGGKAKLDKQGHIQPGTTSGK